MSLKKVLAGIALVVASSIGGGAVGYYLASQPKAAPIVPQETQATIVVAPRKQSQIRTSCYEGILYFTVWNNNAFDKPYLTGAVIDVETFLPKRCVQ